MRDISKLSAKRQRKILDYVGKEIAEGLIDSVKRCKNNEHRRFKIQKFS